VLPRMLHAAFARSPFAHARITRIDASKAARNPGVAEKSEQDSDRQG